VLGQAAPSRILLALWAAFSFALAGVAHAQQGAAEERREAERVAAIKAGVVVNFLRYTTWPASSFKDSANSTAPLVLTLVGDDPMNAALTEAAQGQVVNGRTVEVRRISFPQPRRGEQSPRKEDVDAFYQSMRDSHAAFLGASERNRVADSVAKLAGEPVLTVSDIGDFAENGGMLGLAIRNKRVAFDANEEAIKATTLKVSSKLLKLARLVVSKVTNGQPPAKDHGPAAGDRSGGGTGR
jgi:hypothetical protein